MIFSNDISGPEAIKALGWESLEIRRAKSKAKTMYKVLNNLAPSSLAMRNCLNIREILLNTTSGALLPCGRS